MDVDLIIRAQRGDQEAFGRLAAGLTRSFLSIAHRILRDINLAEDATQQALLAIWQSLPQLREPDRFDAWSHRLLVHACYQEVRRARRSVRAIQVLDVEGATADVAREVLDHDELERAFRRLSIDHRTVVVLRHYRHMSLEQIAETLGIPPGTVASRYHYAMRELRSTLEADARLGQPRVAS